VPSGRTKVAILTTLVSTFALVAACVVENNPERPNRPVVVRVAPLRPASDASVESASTEEAAAVPPGPETGAPEGAPSAAGAAGPESSFLACKVDGDCILVRRNGCCNNGYNEAVNAKSAAAYQASFVCPEPHPICPMFRIHDERVPACNRETLACELVKKTPPP
jgi:hypothetical protein